MVVGYSTSYQSMMRSLLRRSVLRPPCSSTLRWTSSATNKYKYESLEDFVDNDEHFNVKNLYTTESVPGSPRTPNTNTSILPIYVNGAKYDSRVAGLEVVPNAREVLLALYAKCDSLCDQYGTDVFYNEFVKKQTSFRKQIVEANEEIHIIEDTIACGQIEELIEQARDDIETVYHYNEIIMKSEGQPSELGESEEDDSEDDHPVTGDNGIKFTPENIQELYDAIEYPTEEQLAEAMAERQEMADAMKHREELAEGQAMAHTWQNSIVGGGFKAGGGRTIYGNPRFKTTEDDEVTPIEQLSTMLDRNIVVAEYMEWVHSGMLPDDGFIARAKEALGREQTGTKKYEELNEYVAELTEQAGWEASQKQSFASSLGADSVPVTKESVERMRRVAKHVSDSPSVF